MNGQTDPNMRSEWEEAQGAQVELFALGTVQATMRPEMLLGLLSRQLWWIFILRICLGILH